MADPVVELRRISKSFNGGSRAVNDVSFSVERGSLCVLLGPSGCGDRKSVV